MSTFNWILFVLTLISLSISVYLNRLTRKIRAENDSIDKQTKWKDGGKVVIE